MALIEFVRSGAAAEKKPVVAAAQEPAVEADSQEEKEK